MNTLSKQKGFTIVELLIVIVVIGILAAITIVAYNGIQERARVATAQADLSNNAKKMQLYYAENGAYPSTPTQLLSVGLKVSNPSATTISLVCGSASGYVIFINEKTDYTGRQFKIGNNLPITEVSPKLAWDYPTMCATTPYGGIAWNYAW